MKRKYPYRTANKERLYYSSRLLSAFFLFIVIIILCCLLFLIWFRPLRIGGDTMAPTLVENEIILLDQLAKYWRRPQRGDIVFFEDGNGIFVKRIIALSGESIDIKEGLVYIDSRPLDESSYVNELQGDMNLLLVPRNSVFVLGDKRSQMYDSRLETVGCIPYAHIKGVLRVRLIPITRFTLFF